MTRQIIRADLLSIILAAATNSLSAQDAYIDIWPSLADAVQAATQSAIAFLDEYPGLEVRACLFSGESADPATPLVKRLLADHDIKCLAGVRNSKFPHLTTRHRKWQQGGVIEVRVSPDGPTSTAKYRVVPWLEPRAAVNKKGPFTLVVGWSDWKPSLVQARCDSLP